MELRYVDFIPKISEEVPFSTLSLSGRIAGPKCECFNMLIERANTWLSRHRGSSLVTCETLDLEGVYEYRPADVNEEDASYMKEDIVPAFVRVLRLWVSTRPDSPTPAGTGGGVRLGCVNVLPTRLESTPHAFGPSFEYLSEMVGNFNERLNMCPDALPGRLLCIQTSACRFTSAHCSLDPSRTFWLTVDPEEVNVCHYIQLFYIEHEKPVHDLRLGFKDFAPDYSSKKVRKKPETCDNLRVLLTRAHDWLEANIESKHMINMQVVDNCFYYQIFQDITNPDLIRSILDKPHFMTSLQARKTHHTRVLRVYYMSADRRRSNSDIPRTVIPDACKIVHVPDVYHVDGNRFKDDDIQCILGKHITAVKRMNVWLSDTGAKVLGVASLKLVTGNRRKVTISAERSYVLSGQHNSNLIAFAIAVYSELNGGSGTSSRTRRRVDFEPEPKHISLGEHKCDIL